MVIEKEEGREKGQFEKNGEARDRMIANLLRRQTRLPGQRR
jgi:hypothetical protein